MVYPNKKPGLMSRKVLLGATVGAALFFMIMGVIFWGGFNTAMEATNTMTFCISCHEMEENVYQEYKQTIHYSNRSGVRASCSDCHVPDPWVHKVVRKVQASRELLSKAMGTVDTPEKFDEHRLTLARRVWTAMKKTDSRECRNCHDFASMNPANQQKRSRVQHMNAMEAGNTCIDCHKGIAHKKVHDLLTDDELDVMERPIARHKRDVPVQWLALSEPDEEKTAQAAAPQQVAHSGQLVAEVKPAIVAEPETVSSEQTAATAGDFGTDWSSIPAKEIVLFFPGQASMEWVLTGSDHGGARPLKAGDRCYDCHLGEEQRIGDLIVSGEKIEGSPIPDKRGSIAVNVQAAHDSEYLYMRFQWSETAHVPVPFVEGGKMDPDNPVKLAVMLATDDESVEWADLSGCWQSCHHDANNMPDTPGAATAANGVTKYLAESRTDIELAGKGDVPRGGWDKKKDDAAIQAALEAGQFMDLLRYKAGTGESEDGYILAERVMTGGQGVSFSGGLAGGIWTIEMKRRLVSDQAGDISLVPGDWYNFGFAIHDDYSSSRFHHVSLGFKLALDDEDAEINAIGQ
ncbi:MAG: NapC/NirT family cytochrome c [Thiogranum sp.]|nr:NapC/NirT family cytochrome c [Thiogranum sp.]